MSAIGIVSTLFTIIASRHYKALFITLGLVAACCPFLAVGQYEDAFKKIGGVILSMAGAGAFYLCCGELINEEFKAEIIPGLKKPFACFESAPPDTEDAWAWRYDDEKNTVHVWWNHAQYLSFEAADEWLNEWEAVLKDINRKVHVVANYSGCQVGDAIQEHWVKCLAKIQAKYYLSVSRVTFTDAFLNEQSDLLHAH